MSAREMTDVIGVLESLPVAVRAVRVARRLSLREAAKESGIHFTTLGRLECGEEVTLRVALLALRWLAGEAT